MSVRVMALVRRDLRETIKGYGSVRAFRECDVASEVTGQVIKVSPAFEVE